MALYLTFRIPSYLAICHAGDSRLDIISITYHLVPFLNLGQGLVAREDRPMNWKSCDEDTLKSFI